MSKTMYRCFLPIFNSSQRQRHQSLTFAFIINQLWTHSCTSQVTILIDQARSFARNHRLIDPNYRPVHDKQKQQNYRAVLQAQVQQRNRRLQLQKRKIREEEQRYDRIMHQQRRRIQSLNSKPKVQEAFSKLPTDSKRNRIHSMADQEIQKSPTNYRLNSSIRKESRDIYRPFRHQDISLKLDDRRVLESQQSLFRKLEEQRERILPGFRRQDLERQMNELRSKLKRNKIKSIRTEESSWPIQRKETVLEQDHSLEELMASLRNI